MTDRDDLAQLIKDYVYLDYAAGDIADSILAEGWRQQHTVTSDGELDTLPIGIVIRDAEGVVCERWALPNAEDSGWKEVGRSQYEYTDPVLPITMLWTPEDLA